MYDQYKRLFYYEIRTLDKAVKVRTKDRRGDLSLSALRLIFLKYAVDNHIGAKTIEDMEVYAEAHRAISSYDGEKTVQMIPKVLDYVESEYGLKGILNNEVILKEYENDINGTDETKKYQATDKHFHNILEAISTADLKDDADKSIGKGIASVFFTSISATSKWNKAASELSSSDYIALIGREILNVSSEDAFLDFASGIGGTTLVITRDADPKIINIDSDEIACCADAMALILTGHTKLDIRCENSLDKDYVDITADKVFVDYVPDKPAEMIRVIDKAISSCRSNDGKCVMTVSKKFLITAEQQAVEYKKKLVESRILECVVALDDNYLLVLGNNKADGLRFIFTYGDELASEGKLRARYNAENISGKLTALVPFNAIGRYDEDGILGEYNISPTLYFQEDKYEIDIKSVNKELDASYKQLKQLKDPIRPVKMLDDVIKGLMDEL